MDISDDEQTIASRYKGCCVDINNIQGIDYNVYTRDILYRVNSFCACIVEDVHSGVRA